MKENRRQRILITGGSRGIGKALVETFKRKGWKVATCSTNLKNLSESVADVKFQCDLTRVNEVKEGIRFVLQELGPPDVLVNNAGLAGSNSLDPKDPDDLWHQILNVNLNGPYYFCKYLAQHLPDGRGRIINIASVLGLKGVPDATAYCAAKHGVIGFTRSLSHTLAPRKITVNAVCPGWVRTDMAFGRMEEIGINESQLQASVPLGRFIEPQEISEFIYTLADSDGMSMITGQALTIDGGVLA